MICVFCKTKAPEGKILFRDECAKCGRDLHICMNCGFYDPHASKECREPAIPETVRDKERKNLCEYFRPGGNDQGSAGDSAAEAARQKLESLFKS